MRSTAPAQQMGPHDPNPQPAGQTIPLKKIKDQRVAVDYVHWGDFRWSPCRVWGERRWVARRVFMTREQLTKRFGKAKANAVRLDHSTMKAKRRQRDRRSLSQGRAQEGRGLGDLGPHRAQGPLVRAGVPRRTCWTPARTTLLQLQSFEPCPSRCSPTSRRQHRSPAGLLHDSGPVHRIELRECAHRAARSRRARWSASTTRPRKARCESLFTGNENTMVPVPNWGQFSEKGGIKGSVDWIPLESVVTALEKLTRPARPSRGRFMNSRASPILSGGIARLARLLVPRRSRPSSLPSASRSSRTRWPGLLRTSSGSRPRSQSTTTPPRR